MANSTIRRWGVRLSALVLLLALFFAGLLYWSNQVAGPNARFSSLPLRMVGASRDAAGWPTYGGPSDGTKYSSLDQVNRANVDQLEVAWEFHTGDTRQRSPTSNPTTVEFTPILADGKLIFCTPLNTVIALEPDTGKQLWRFNFAKSPKQTVNPVYNCRGVAYWEAQDRAEAERPCGKRVLQGTDTGVLMALDASTGRLCDRFGRGGMIDLNALDYHGEGRVGMTSPPAVVGDVVVVGGSIKDNKLLDEPDGIVRGFDVRTGQERWAWNPIPPELSSKTGAANAWGTISVDQTRGWVFVPTGNPSHDLYGAGRVNPIPDANAVVALDGRTGRKVWSYQTVRHAVWDYDVSAMPTLVTLERGGRPVDAVIQGTKTGFLFVLDRETGRPLFPVKERVVPRSDIPGEVTAPTQPVPVLPEALTGQHLTEANAWGATFYDRNACRAEIRRLRNEGIFTPPSTRGTLVYPGYLSGINWGGVAFDHASGLAVMASVDMPFVEALIPRDRFDRKAQPEGTSVYDLEGTPYVMTRRPLLSPFGAPCSPPPWGKLTAMDMRTGKIRWQIPFGRQPMFAGLMSPARWGGYVAGGPVVTAGGLVFIGATLDSRFRAFDLASGRELWSAAVPAPAVATPMTYRAGPDGRQFIVIAAGGHSSLKTKQSDAVIAFALPKRPT